MSRQDPGAATGTGVYPQDPVCVCGHSAPLHAFGRRADKTVRTSCSTSTCPCTRYESAPSVVEPARCPTCGAGWSAIEAARRTP